MKIVSYLVLVAALYLSWQLFNGEGALVPERVHMELRKSLSAQLTQSIVEARPEAYGIEVKEFWTEAISNKEVQAHFTFEFEEPDSDGNPVHIEKSASATVRKISHSDEVQKWSADQITLEGQVLVFKKGLTISQDQD